MAIVQIDDDIYDGYNDYPSVYSIKDLEQDELFHEALNTSYAKRSIVSVNEFHIRKKYFIKSSNQIL